MKKSIFILAAIVFFATCSPFQEKEISLPAQPDAPNFSMEFLPNDANRVVVKDLSAGFFDRSWSFKGGIPAASKRSVDTIFYPKSGDFETVLFVASEGGGGVSKSTKIAAISQNAVAVCDPQIGLLTGDCEIAGKCWTLSHEAKAIVVGPTPGSNEWYKSPVNGLQNEQYDDQFCFYFDGSRFQYNNNGLTIDPWNSYAAVPFAAPTDLTWFISKGTGDGGKDQIVLPAGAFLGTWDSGSVYDIASLAGDKMVLRSPIRAQNGSPGMGWFEFTFVKI
jgi:hypothetical protein